ncbi:hypothetical protein [Desulfocurvibacter africanus]|uniref:hypothetical protein n=1 Tax=Desulfocurvibacter africanus TaxID=873 RepID=UPI000480E0BE|nr:hypothetical protein [Desulfocurvibacter africanus]
MTHQAGDFVEAHCGKCGDALRHAVVALVNGEVVKVQCMVCGSTHKYKPTTRQAKTDSPGTVRRTKTASGVSTTRVSTPRSPAKATSSSGKAARGRRDWEEQMAKRDVSTAKPYSMGACFAEGDLVDHSKFGFGIVTKTTRPDKMVILFEEGPKVLRCTL